MATMWSDTVLRRIAKCALPSFGEALFIVLNPQYPILATGVLPPRDGPKGSPFFLGRTGVSLIEDMSGAGSSLPPLKSRMIKAPSSSGSRPLFIIEISDAFAIEEHLAGGRHVSAHCQRHPSRLQLSENGLPFEVDRESCQGRWQSCYLWCLCSS